MAACVGTVIISILVTVIDHSCRFQEPEENVIKLIKKDDSRVYARHLAATRLQYAWLAYNDSMKKSSALNLGARVTTARVYWKLSHIIMRWRNFGRKMR